MALVLRDDDMPAGGGMENCTLWVVNDGRTGDLNQCLGIAEALGFNDPEQVIVRMKPWGKWFGFLPAPMVFEQVPYADQPDKWPDVVIGAGANTSRYLRWLKKVKPGLFAVQVMRPLPVWFKGRGAGYKGFDVVTVPAHDNPPRLPNVCVTTGAPNRVTRDMLAKEAQRWQSRLKACESPRLAVLVGGSTKRTTFSVQDAQDLAESILAWAKQSGGSLMVTTSRRTGHAATVKLKAILNRQQKVAVHFWEPDDPAHRDNPFMGYLGMADAVLVTGDSVSMVSEACTAAKPTYVWGDWKFLPRKFQRFLNTLKKQGRADAWSGRLTLRQQPMGLMDTMIVAGFIKSRWLKRQHSSSGR